MRVVHAGVVRTPYCAGLYMSWNEPGPAKVQPLLGMVICKKIAAVTVTAATYAEYERPPCNVFGTVYPV